MIELYFTMMKAIIPAFACVLTIFAFLFLGAAMLDIVTYIIRKLGKK